MLTSSTSSIWDPNYVITAPADSIAADGASADFKLAHNFFNFLWLLKIFDTLSWSDVIIHNNLRDFIKYCGTSSVKTYVQSLVAVTNMFDGLLCWYDKGVV